MSRETGEGVCQTEFNDMFDKLKALQNKKQLKNKKRRERKKLKKKCVDDGKCCVCAREFCSKCADCFAAKHMPAPPCNCPPFCAECFIRRFVAEAKHCEEPNCDNWHFSCPGCDEPTSCGPIHGASAFNSVPAMFEGINTLNTDG